MVGSNGRSDLRGAGDFADLLGLADPRPRLVVLNSCSSGEAGVRDLFSSTGATLARRGITAVVGMQYAVSDDAALAFSHGFYEALAAGRGVDEAVRSGRVAILGSRANTLEWVTPLLYLRGIDAHIFARSPDPETTDDGDIPDRAVDDDDGPAPSGSVSAQQPLAQGRDTAAPATPTKKKTTSAKKKLDTSQSIRNSTPTSTRRKVVPEGRVAGGDLPSHGISSEANPLPEIAAEGLPDRELLKARVREGSPERRMDCPVCGMQLQAHNLVQHFDRKHLRVGDADRGSVAQARHSNSQTDAQASGDLRTPKSRAESVKRRVGGVGVRTEATVRQEPIKTNQPLSGRYEFGAPGSAWRQG